MVRSQDITTGVRDEHPAKRRRAPFSPSNSHDYTFRHTEAAPSWLSEPADVISDRVYELWADSGFFQVDDLPDISLPFDLEPRWQTASNALEFDDHHQQHHCHRQDDPLSISRCAKCQMQVVIPQMYPSTPRIEDRTVDLSIIHPFTSDLGKPRHVSLRQNKFQMQGGTVNGYIKFRLRSMEQSASKSMSNKANYAPPRTLKRSRDDLDSENPFDLVPKLPPHFGLGVKLDSMDSKLLKFCMQHRWRLAFCCVY